MYRENKELLYEIASESLKSVLLWEELKDKLGDLATGLSPRLSDAALHASDSLKYRDFVTVAVILKDRNIRQTRLRVGVPGNDRSEHENKDRKPDASHKNTT